VKAYHGIDWHLAPVEALPDAVIEAGVKKTNR
jgi:hypothetical protein